MSQIAIRPVDALLDQPVAIEVTNVKPRSRVRLGLRNHTLRAEAHAEFIVSAEGIVDVAAQPPVAGDYEGTDSAGLFWSARFDAGSDVVSMVNALSRLELLAYTLTVSADDGRETTVNFTRRLVASDVVQTPVRDGRIRGTLFAIKGATNAPGVIVLGGSDGGNLWAFVAALLAAHGMVALSLPYFAYEDLPKDLIEIPLEYFGEAIEWLRARPEVGAARMGVLGMSRGGEAALLLGATFPQVATVVALVPSGVVGGGNGADFSAMGKPAWTLNGIPFPILPPPWDPVSMKEAQEAMSAGKPLAGAPGILRALESAGARVDDVAIRVERARGPIFLMSGEDDQLWGSTRLTEIAEKRLKRRRFPFRSSIVAIHRLAISRSCRRTSRRRATQDAIRWSQSRWRSEAHQAAMRRHQLISGHASSLSSIDTSQRTSPYDVGITRSRYHDGNMAARTGIEPSERRTTREAPSGF